MGTILTHTIAILGYNNHAITMQNIRHIRHHGCNDLILFLDNGSQPSFEPLLAEIPSVLYIRKEKNIYVNPAWNELFDTVTSRYLTLLNNDCFLLSPGYFSEILPHMDTNAIVLSSAKTTRVKKMPDTVQSSLFHRWLQNQPLRYRTRARRQGWLMTIDMHMYRTCEYHIPDYLKIWFGDDWIWAQIIRNGFTTAVYTNRFALHLDVPTTISRSIADIIRADKENLEKYGAWYNEMLPVIHCKTRLTSRYA